MKRAIISSLAFIICVGMLYSQSKTVELFQSKSNGYDLYIYQSVIRMLNKDKNPDFNMMIRNLDHLKLVTTEDIGAASMASFKKLDMDIRQEGYEEVMSFDSRESKCHLFEKGETWVATFHFSGYAGVFEMKGELDLNYVKSLNSLDIDRLKDMLPVEEMIVTRNDRSDIILETIGLHEGCGS